MSVWYNTGTMSGLNGLNGVRGANSGDPDAVIEEFLEAEPRAQFWRELRESLQGRLNDAKKALEAASPQDPQQKSLEARVNELREQVAALAQEEAVTEFVEDSVRQSVNKVQRPGAFIDGFDEFDEEI